MKKITSLFTFTLFAAALSLTSCNNNPPSDKKVEDAKEDVQKAKEDLRQAENDYDHEWQQYRDEQYAKIRDNEKRLSDYRVKIKDEKPAVRERHEKRVAELEAENNQVKVKLDTYKGDKSNWQQ